MVESADEAGGGGDIRFIDDRKERFDVMGGPLERAALASVALARGPFVPMEDFALQVRSAGAVNSLCPDERFREQPTLARCGGTLIDDDLVVTAAHCLAALCNPYDAVMLDFAYEEFFSDPNKIVRPIPGNTIYTCEAVELHNYDRANDFAIVRLDRPVTDRVPARIATTPLAARAAISAIGHPKAVPQKISPGVVRGVSTDLIHVNADTMAGNSGGGLFNDRGELAGVAVRGYNVHYQPTREGCQRASVCLADDCPSTVVEPIAKILARAPAALAAEIARSQALLPP